MSLDKINVAIGGIIDTFIANATERIKEGSKLHAVIDLPDNGVYMGTINNQQQPHGVGILLTNKFTKEAKFVGKFENGTISGIGISFQREGSANTLQYIGYWKNDLYHGLGSLFGLFGVQEYIGDWQNGKRHGYGTSKRIMSCRIMTHYSGNWKDNLYHGYGCEYDHTGNVLNHGNFINGAFVGVGSEYENQEKFANDLMNSFKTQNQHQNFTNEVVTNMMVNCKRKRSEDNDIDEDYKKLKC
jgi:antitoxin component YwqK of YwqJK toxin-antitoxin module